MKKRNAFFGLLVAAALAFYACDTGGDDKPSTVTTYTVTVADSAKAGISVNPAKGAAGTAIVVTVNPPAGKLLKADSLKYNDGTADTAITGKNSDGTYQFALPARNVTVNAEFANVPANNYTVTIGALTNGKIIATPTYGEAGNEISLAVQPDTGYLLQEGSLKYKGESTDAVVITGTSFALPAYNVTVTAAFDKAANASDYIKAGIDALINEQFDNAIDQFEAAYKAYPTDPEAIAYSSLGLLASIAKDKETAEFVSKYAGIKNYPGTIGSLISGSWLQEYDDKEIIRWYHDDASSTWAKWYDPADYDDDQWMGDAGINKAGYWAYVYEYVLVKAAATDEENGYYYDEASGHYGIWFFPFFFTFFH